MLKASYDNLIERWIIVDGLPVRYWESVEEHVDAPVIIHLHGFAISGTYLLPTANLLATTYRTFVPDLPGFGRSHHPVKVLSIHELATALFGFMDAVGVERATLVGNSMGCITAIEAARMRPDRVDRTVLVSPAGGPHNRPIFRGVFQLALDGLREPPSMFVIAVPDYLRYRMVNAARLFWSMIHFPTVERFRETTTPSLVVLGRRDPLVNEQRILDGTAANANVAVVRFEEAAHAINYSHPKLLARLIRQFITGSEIAADPAAPGAAVVIRQLGRKDKSQFRPKPPEVESEQSMVKKTSTDAGGSAHVR